MTDNHDVARRAILYKSWVLLIVWILILALILFVPAGIHWIQGWLFLLVFFVYTVASAWYLWRVNPEIYIARSKVHEGTKSWDKVLMVLLLTSLLAIFLTAALDARYGWSAV